MKARHGIFLADEIARHFSFNLFCTLFIIQIHILEKIKDYSVKNILLLQGTSSTLLPEQY